MHHALTISEILYETFSYLPEFSPYLDVSYDNPGGSRGHKTLAALAVTCRTFRDPALAVRWRRLYGVKPLLFLFPTDIWLISDDPDGDQDDVESKLARLPSKEEWIRFESYTAYIREILIGPGAFNGIVQVMAALSMKYLPHPSRHLFPKLQSLIWITQETTGLPLVHLFFPPSLRCLDLEFRGSMQLGVPAMLLLLEYQCPIFTQLRISGLDDDEQDVATVSRALESRSWRQLETLHCTQIDESALLHLAQLPTLKDLSIHLPGSVSTTVTSNKGFINLHTLSLVAEDITAAIPFLWSAQLLLKSLQITLSARKSQLLPLPLSSLQQLFSSISKGLSPTRLTQIEIRRWCDDQHFDITLDITTLQPLLVFSKLKHVCLDDLCSFDLNDDALTELANAWPHLEELVLNHCTGWRRTSGITFKGLASLLRACPMLHTLALSIDATQLSFISSTSPGEVIQNDRIKTIDLGDSIIENPAAVALILDDLFWALKHVDAWRMYSRGDEKLRYEPLWDEVNMHLLIGKSRKQHEAIVTR
ncbi:hypothetical protein BJ138DRAFT_282798 [Hygrophoropsis aurantiaca]|uniref:Uncharacterized protein n=1 Tax=Hygrophoropsis aurantiaca TaxID=72124 RepID=A0ACB8ASC7_9AGAM|nr:hypothetical protein BJ138DRAFT_282798 [Hygrophoropsis aurantiaca]